MRPHPDVDLLALHALGEPVLDAPAAAHLVGCDSCTQTVQELAGSVRTVTSSTASTVYRTWWR